MFFCLAYTVPCAADWAASSSFTKYLDTILPISPTTVLSCSEDVMPGIITIPRFKYNSGVTLFAVTVSAIPGNLFEKFTSAVSFLIAGLTGAVNAPVTTAFGDECTAGQIVRDAASCLLMSLAMRPADTQADACDRFPARIMLPVPNIKNLPSSIVRIR